MILEASPLLLERWSVMIATVQQPDVPVREPMNVLEQIAAEPALLQLVVLALLGFVGWIAWNRMAHAVREARGRAATRDFLIGVEQVLHGDPARAAKRLENVLSEDPENTTARLYYALALAELGKPGEAHKHHVQLARGFGVASLRNQAALAESLLDGGRAGEAVDVVVELAGRHPHDVQVGRLELRAQLAAGNQREAGDAALRLVRRLPAGAERDRVREQGARAFAMAAKVQIGRGDLTAARDLLERAARCRGDLTQTRRTALLLDFAEGGDAAVVKFLAVPRGAESDPGETRPAVVDSARLPGPRAVLGALSPAGAYCCTACDAPLAEPLATCPHCGASGKVRATEPELVTEVESPVHVIDAIEENRAHVQRLLRRVGSDDGDAASELLAIGDSAVEETLACAVEAGPEDTVWLPLLQRMGPSIVPALFEAYRRRKEDWLVRFGELIGRRSASAVVGRVVQSFGREALPWFRDLLDSADRELRSVIIDYFIGLADQDEFVPILERFPPVEIVRRLERAPADVLRRFVATIEPGSFQAQVLLTEPAFTRDVDVFLSIGPDATGAAEEILERRGFSRTLVRVLIEHLTDEVRGPVAERLLDRLGERGADVEVAAFTDPDRDPAVRDRLRQRLERGDRNVVESLCECLGAAPSPLDDEVGALLVSIGDGAVDALGDAYRQGSVLEKFAGALVSRDTHRRATIAKLLARIGTKRAQRRLSKLRKTESDPNLKLRLDQALHRIDTADDEQENHGQTG